MYLAGAGILSQTLRSATDATILARQSPVAWKEIGQLTNTKSLAAAKAACGEAIAGAIGYMLCTEQRGDALANDLASGKVVWDDMCKVARKVSSRCARRRFFLAWRCALSSLAHSPQLLPSAPNKKTKHNRASPWRSSSSPTARSRPRPSASW
jgi:hypothetical protein